MSSWSTATWTPDTGIGAGEVALSRTVGRDAFESLTTTVDGTDHTYTYTGTGEGDYFGAIAITERELDGQDPLTFDTDEGGRTFATGPWTWAFDNPGQMVAGASDGTTTVRHDADTLQHPTGMSLTVGATDIVDVAVTHDDVGRVTARTVTVDGTTTEERYGYDLDGQLVEVRDGTDAVVASYTYDDRGNRVSWTEDATTTTATYDLANRLTGLDDGGGAAVVASNANGQVTGIHGMTLTHLPTGELVEVADGGGTIATYSYDAIGRRTSRVDADGDRTTYLYGDTADSLLVTATIQTSAGGGTPVVTEYVYEQGTRFLTALRRDGVWYSVATDVVGTPIAVVDDTGTVVLTRDHDAWGVLRAETGTFDLPIGFAGGLADPDTGLVRFGIRDYDPATGRWLQADPALIASGDANLYRYAGNTPTTLVDPAGTDAATVQVCAYGACIEIEVACDDSGCSVCLGGGGGSPGGSVGYDPNQGARGSEIYAQTTCGFGPFEIGYECRIILCAPSNPDVAQAKCEIKGPLTTGPNNDFLTPPEKLKVGCSSTLGGCSRI